MTKIALAALFGGALPVLASQPASGLVGDLSNVGCVDDNDIGPEQCSQTTDALEGIQSVIVSSDGKSVYGASSHDDAVVIFDRGIILTPAGCVDDNDTGPEECTPNGGGVPNLAKSTNGLTDVIEVAASSDGKSVYAVSPTENAIVRFNRSNTGALYPAGCIDDNDVGPDECAQSTNGLEGANSLAVSPDGKSVYVVSYFDDAIVHFVRDTGTGALTPAGCLDDDDSGPDTCPYGGQQLQDLSGLTSAMGVAVSPDGKSVYVVSDVDNAIVTFKRNTSTGVLTVAGCVEDNDVGPDGCTQSTNGLEGAVSVAVSPDGKSVYVGSSNDDAIVLLKRNTSAGVLNGKLTPDWCIDDKTTPAQPFAGPDNCQASADGLLGVSSVAVSSDGQSVYSTSEHDLAVAIFRRRPQPSGRLSGKGCIDDNTGPDPCAQSSVALKTPGSIAVSSDGLSVYVAGAFFDNAITQFERQIQ